MYLQRLELMYSKASKIIILLLFKYRNVKHSCTLNLNIRQFYTHILLSVICTTFTFNNLLLKR